MPFAKFLRHLRHKISHKIRWTWYLLAEIWRRFRRDGCSTRAAALAFTTLLSVVPLLTLSFIVLSAFPIFQHTADKVQIFVIENFVATSAQVIQEHLSTFVQQASKLSAIGTFLLLVSAVLMVFNMEQAFNMIWRVKKPRRFIAAFLLYWAVLTLAPLLIGTGMLVSKSLTGLPFIAKASHLEWLKKLLNIVLPYLGALMTFTVLYLAVPNCKVRFKHAFIGGVVGSILFELAKQGFGLYISHFTNYRLLYGALSAMPIFLVWIYLCWIIILLGAVVSAVLTTPREHHVLPLTKEQLHSN